MFGQKLDYMFLRLLSHRRNIASEEELDSRYSHYLPLEAVDKAILRLNKYLFYFKNHFTIDDNHRYLDIGCGTGELTIALAKKGCKHIAGIDIVPRNIEKASHYTKKLNMGSRVQFICEDIFKWKSPTRYDVVMSFDAFEHINNPKALLKKMSDLVTPNGVAIVSFGPLFYSPFGDHMGEFFRIRIPWRGALFSERALLRLRHECFRPTDQAHRFQDIVGGLNLMKYSNFLRYVNETGWEFNFLAVNPTWRRILPLYYFSSILIRIPIVRDYFAGTIYAILRRK